MEGSGGAAPATDTTTSTSGNGAAAAPNSNPLPNPWAPAGAAPGALCSRGVTFSCTVRLYTSRGRLHAGDGLVQGSVQGMYSSITTRAFPLEREMGWGRVRGARCVVLTRNLGGKQWAAAGASGRVAQGGKHARDHTMCRVLWAAWEQTPPPFKTHQPCTCQMLVQQICMGEA